jgi:hypothetical protein
MATITDFKWPLLHRNQHTVGDLPEYVLVRFDDPNIALLHGSQDKVRDSIKIKPATVTFQGNMLLFK